jgi:hypothetical protein
LLIEKNDRFAMRVLEEPKLFVVGNESEFAKLNQDRSTR